MTGRSIPEWIGASPDSQIPPRVKLRIWERCGGKCALTGRKLLPGDAYDFDHIVALANGGENRERNVQVVCRIAHKVKTRADVEEKSKTYRMAAKHAGTWPKSPRPLQGRPFAKRNA